MNLGPNTDRPEPAPADRPPAAPPLYGAPGYGFYGASADTGPRETRSLIGELSPSRLLRVIRKKWVTLFLVMTFALAAGGFYYLNAKRVYQAECLIEMSLLRPRITGQRGAVIDDAYMSQSDEIFNTRLAKFKTPAMLDMALTNLQKTVDTTSFPPQKLREMMKKKVKMTLVRRSRLVSITFSYTDPAFAAAAANAFGQAAETFAADESRASSDGAVAWLQQQVIHQREALEKADRALVEFSKNNQVDALERQKLTTEQSLAGFNETLTQIRSQEYLAREVYDAIVALELKPEEAGKMPDAAPRAQEIQLMLEQWRTAISERDALLTKYTAKHPEVIAQEKVIKVRRQQAMAALGRAKQTAASNLSLLGEQAESLRKKIEEQSTLVADVELQIVERRAKRAALERERDAADISYKGILNRIEEARLSADENTATVKVVSPARLPEIPVWPSLLKVGFIAILLGGVAGLGLALVTDTMEDFATNTDDLERDLGLRVLAVVPHVVDEEDSKLATAGMGEDLGHLLEAFAGIRGLLDSPQYKDGTNSVLVTSTTPEEGKTVTACNLAISCARGGSRTLLVDFDMRRPRVASVFGLSSENRSLIHALAADKTADFSTLTHKTSCKGLELITTQPGEGLNAADIIGGRAVRKFLEWAESSYDRVIIDSPPFGIIRDSAVLAGMVGSVLLVCRPDRSRRGAMIHAIGHFRDMGANVLGLIVNDVDFGSTPYLRFLGTHYSAYSYASYYGESVKGKGKKKRAKS